MAKATWSHQKEHKIYRHDRPANVESGEEIWRFMFINIALATASTELIKSNTIYSGTYETFLRGAKGDETSMI
jgi:hypothetical protein